MDNKKLIFYPIFQPYKKLLAFTTTKQTIHTKAARYSNSAKNREKLAEVLQLDPGSLVFPKQTHTNCVANIGYAQTHELNDTDALIANLKGKCLCVQTADCVPLLLFDKQQEVIAAVHAGWRGTVSKIVEKTLWKMKRDYHSQPENILCAIGPSISPEVYEVGDEVVEKVRQEIPHAETTLNKNKKGNYHFNLWEANRQIMLKNGILPQHIELSSYCSFLEKDKFYSARRDGVETGRMVSGIMLYP
jgi:YfiH family protein